MTTTLPAEDSRNAQEDLPEIPTRRGFTVLLLVSSIFMSLGWVSFAENYYEAVHNDVAFGFKVFSMIAAVAVPFLLRMRAKRPYAASLLISGFSLIFQLDPMLVAFGVAGVVARRSDWKKIAGCIGLGFVASFVTVMSDLMIPGNASLIATLTNKTTSEALHPAGGQMTALAWSLCVLIPLVELAVAFVAGMTMRSTAISKRSMAQAESERQRANTIQTNLSNAQIADSIAAEAHDTLAHSLSLIAVNAASLGADVEKLKETPTDPGIQSDIQRRADDLRGQSAGALDEAHSIIDMLRHPDQAAQMLTPDADTALTQPALDALFSDVRDSGTQLSVWVDIRGLSALSPSVGKIAYRVVQEGLTNARRHAPQSPVSVNVSVIPASGITIAISNPVPAVPVRPASHDTHSGNGLPGLAGRVQKASGTCRYGVDKRGVFHLDVTLPFVPIS